MKAGIVKALPPHDAPDVLCLIPDSEADQQTLERLLADYRCVGFGRHPETRQVLHLELPLTPIKEQA